MRNLMILLVLVVGCDAEAIPQREACTEQAAEWCAGAGYATSGCHLVYERNCGFVGSVSTDDQVTCLAAIVDNTRPDREPDECVTTWSSR